jgi:hypothetical protein
VPRHARPSRDTPRSHTPDAPRAIDAPAASSLVSAVLPRPWMFFNGRLAPAHQYARPGQASQAPYSDTAPMTDPTSANPACRVNLNGVEDADVR